METSPEIKNIAKALKEWHELQITITKDSENPHFRSKFASLDNIIETIRVPLASRGLSFTQFPDGDGLTTMLLHSPSGEWIKATANLKLAKEDPQGQGSAYTYARRYGLSAVLGLATDEDDDGNEASKPSQSSHKAPPATKPAKPTKDTGKELLASKDRTKTLLGMLGYTDLKTKKDYEDMVFKLTDFVLADKDIDAINEKLAALVEKRDAKN